MDYAYFRRLASRTRFFHRRITLIRGGLIAIGGDLSGERLLEAYRVGIFPWYSEDQPLLWWSPDPRFVLELDNFKISRSLQKTRCEEEFFT